jgi:hypothetical protein
MSDEAATSYEDDDDKDDDGEGEDGEDEDGEDDPDTSLDNFGSMVRSRQQGRERGRMIPDFIESKATSSIDNDTLIALIEVKKSDISELKARMQMKGYMQRAATKVNREKKLLGFLVMGDKSVVYELVPEENDDVRVKDTVPTCGDKFEEYLRGIAEKWA